MKKSLIAASLGLACSFGTAHAIDSEDFRFSGYLSLVGGLSTDSNITYNTNPVYGATGYDDDFALDVDSKAGVQMDATINDQWSATVQLLSRGVNDYKPELSWAYLSYDYSDETKIRFGRLRLPFYMYSDFNDVGYAYPWISTPRTAYFVEAENIDAIDVLYSFSTENVEHQIQAYVGQINEEAEGPDAEEFDLDVETALGVIYTPRWENLTLRFAFHQAFNLDSHASAFVNLGEGVAAHPGSSDAAIERVSPMGKDVIFFGLGMRYDFDPMYVMGEYTTAQWDDYILPDTHRIYLTVGGRVTDDVELFATYQQADHKVNTTAASGVVDTDLQNGINGIANSANESKSFGVGARWNVTSTVSLKAQIDQHDIDNEGITNVMRISLDTIF